MGSGSMLDISLANSSPQFYISRLLKAGEFIFQQSYNKVLPWTESEGNQSWRQHLEHGEPTFLDRFAFNLFLQNYKYTEYFPW